jgi:hypothetical protein
MAVVQRVMAATPEQIFAVLADGWSYSDWVVGTAHIRDVDRDWPNPGAQLHHKVAGLPLSPKDKTVVLDSAPPHWIVMRPYVWPLGELTASLTLTPINGGATSVTLAEQFTAGPVGRFRSRIDDLFMHWRLREGLRRLSDLATRKHAATAG